MPNHVYLARSWQQARSILESLRPDLPISYGTGNPICRPYVRAVHLDADAGEGLGYRVAIKPVGDGYGSPAEHFLIYIATTPNNSYTQMHIPRMVVSETRFTYIPQNKQILRAVRPRPQSILSAS